MDLLDIGAGAMIAAAGAAVGYYGSLMLGMAGIVVPLPAIIVGDRNERYPLVMAGTGAVIALSMNGGFRVPG